MPILFRSVPATSFIFRWSILLRRAGPVVGSRPKNRLRAMESCVDERGVLVDRLDAQVDGVGRVTDPHLLAAHVDLPGGGAHRSRQDLDERRLARAVVAQQADDLPLLAR
ncbi:MAG: hypothetical protein U5J97_02390 [Trueperaceae bacterium]|nr:hypothetical protein [Trueperaceae bacterium]